ncbi:hypothetical protein K458DRAFT_393177 [Lentithecium fluviatile CBS 122367]|uniref:Uncharacterized protein n=1 Tax=Lentithecium fluviatile CBS 122367 TaxID=1168545 RepID=A0A6G1IQE8_9PLEO|nr:hypothetical protein K458DRAFT_393177 [Lentithecium fluviatile CBS 122367]
MRFPAGCGSAGDAGRSFHDLIDDKTLSPVVSFDLDVPTISGRNDGRPVLIDIKLRGGDTPKPVELPQPHERTTESKAKDEATTVLSGEYLSRISPQI